MNFYKFPIIKSIDDVLPAIKDKEEFIVADKKDYIVIQYVVSKPDTFENPNEPGILEQESLYRALRRECRGLMFTPKGDIMSRSFHKFFNVNEKEETQAYSLDFSQPYQILAKEDGSMVRPVILGDELFYGTKMGITDVAINAHNFADANEQYNKLSFFCYDNGYTPIFEWCSNKNRIVLDYSVDTLLLTAVRCNLTGEYLDFQEIGNRFNIPVVKSFNRNLIEKEGFTRFIESVRKELSIEGYVVRFDSGHMVKIKSEEYCLFHRSKENAESERNIIQAIIDEKIDDLKGLLFKEDLEKVNEVEKWFWETIQNQEYKYRELFDTAYKLSSGDKKKFATEISQKFTNTDVPIIFSLFAGNDLRETLLRRVRKHTFQNKQYEEFKKLHMN
jgi:RNA ligase